MNLIKFLLRTCRGMIIITTLTALLSGACNAALIAVVNMSLNNPKASMMVLVWSFVALVAGKTITNIISQVFLARFAQGAVSDLRRDLTKKILSVPLRQLEDLGTHRVLVALTDDVFNITQALLAIPIITVNVAILIGGAVYLGLLSWKILVGIGVMVLLGGVSYRLMMKSAFKWLNLAREEEDRLFGYFRALTDGIKELKLHRTRRKAFLMENIHDTTETFQKHNVKAEAHFIYAQNWNHLLFYMLVGLILFLMPNIQEVNHAALTGYVITILYLMGPLAGVMSSFSLFSRASVALRKVEDLGLSLSSVSSEDTSIDKPEREVPLRSLELVNVQHAYRHEKEDSNFVLGPINLKFSPGELVFLVGGNGSGKSTLAKIITGLYFPEAGEIRWNGKRVDNGNRDDYRQLFSAIFSDFFLFDNMMGLKRPDLDAQAREYLAQLHLDHKISIKNGVLSTTSVSQGQRKRLALLTAYLEDRQFYMFDEWAADQDPVFKAVFYTQLLPELKAKGKTVLVISHDDKYFYIADRIIKLDYGKMEQHDHVDGELAGSLFSVTR